MTFWGVFRISDLSAIRERFLRDSLPVRLGGIAANMARVRSFSKYEANSGAVSRLIDESKWFIEWTAADFLPGEVDTAAQLVELQIQLAQWQNGWDRRWNDPDQRAQVAARSKEWSDRVLAMSGLLE